MFFLTLTLVLSVKASLMFAPRDVRLTSYNMDLNLSWSPPENVDRDVVYSTRLWAKSQSSPKAACVNTTALHCDLSSPALDLHVLEFGQYNASVRVQSGSRVSDWVESQTIMMDRDTVIGPPDVSVVSNGADLEVIMKEPKLSISTVTDVFGPPQFNISYWSRGQRPTERHKLVQQNRAVLDELEPWTEYCVQVKVYVNPVRNQKPAEPSDPVCSSTEGKPPAPWLAAVLTFVALGLTVTLVGLVVVKRKRIRHFLCPRDSLPQHLPECPRSLPPLVPKEEVYHPLNVVPRLGPEESPEPEGS